MEWVPSSGCFSRVKVHRYVCLCCLVALFLNSQYQFIQLQEFTHLPGDRYLKPWIIPDPEVTIMRREKNDEVLIVASDGLWDVMTNEEACDVARKRILLWHKKYGNNGTTTGQGEGVDPAAQSAAEYLSKLALHRGSDDNISIIVIDLKPQRKLKRKA